jgi:hypothetical protein
MDATLDTKTSPPKLTIVRADAAPTHDPPEHDPPEAATEAATEDKTRRRPVAVPDLLVAFARKKIVESFADDEKIAYAVLPVGKRVGTLAIQSSDFADLLILWADQVYGISVSAQAVSQAQATLAATARAQPRRKIWIRVARQGTKIYLDLCDDEGCVVEIGPDGWQVITEAPVHFVRRPGMLPIPVPLAKSGSLEELWCMCNVPAESRPLVLGWLLATLHPEGPYPVLCVGGEQGTGKSTLIRMLRSFSDPHVAHLRTVPADDKGVAIAARHSWVLAYDNLSSVPPWLSDLLCVLATGGVYSTKTLYSTAEETLMALRRPVAICGIPDLATRSDLLDRAVLVTLEPIETGRRLTEAEVLARFDEALPGMLGALLDAMVVALRRLPSIRLESPPRMADFAALVTAAEPGLGLEDGAFLTAYAEAAESANEIPLDSSPLVEPIRSLIATQDKPTVNDAMAAWEGRSLPPRAPVVVVGTAKELLDQLEQAAGIVGPKKPPGWPGNARGLTAALRRLAPNLRKVGIEVSYPGKRRIRLAAK